tara:strand:- start:31449 stop:31901 length:453 start_codon:yes stop_codon:yes gene_type:complete
MNRQLVGKIYPIKIYEVGREKILEYAQATLCSNPYCTDPNFAAHSKYGVLVAPPTFASVYCQLPMRQVFEDEELGMNVPRVVHGEQSFEFGEVVKAGDVISTSTTIRNIIVKENAAGVKNELVLVRTDSVNQNNEIVCVGRWTIVERGNE